MNPSRRMFANNIRTLTRHNASADETNETNLANHYHYAIPRVPPASGRGGSRVHAAGMRYI
jgi:hypothetical protein